MLLLISSGLYLSQAETLPPNGGSWQGYVLGSIGTLLIIWLSCLGIRKRRYASKSANLQAWVSAHIYLGVSLIGVATLHCAFQFGLNVHTLAYVLMCTVILSGLIGLYAYLRYPRLLVENRANQSFEQRLESLAKIDKEGLALAANCDVEIQSIIASAIDRTAIGGNLLTQFFGRDHSSVAMPVKDAASHHTQMFDNKGQQTVIDFLVAKIPNTQKPGEAERLQKLLYILGRRQEILRRLRRELCLQFRTKLWLSVHIPLSIALLVSLCIHIFTVFFYW
ncbi:hypothetical protein [uncultured Zhongshania sp.]|uniref:hypothetical protein n=1 Tax=uncultured Zhongshania sp. TaxID=1642288 RepID=UPI0025F1DF8C|nr:hypothetical protein [uncultured Zhongshania sp.]